MQLIKLTIFFLFLQSCLDANIKKKPSNLKNDKANVFQNGLLFGSFLDTNRSNVEFLLLNPSTEGGLQLQQTLSHRKKRS